MAVAVAVAMERELKLELELTYVITYVKGGLGGAFVGAPFTAC